MGKLKRKEYQALLEAMQVELNDMARWVQDTGQRMLIIFEGRDTAGKGGAIRSISDRLNPRMCRVVGLAKPSEREAGQWYFQRYVSQLPSAGEIVLFDRSWYNRAGVERVMGYASEDQVEAFLRLVPGFEKAITADGILLFKYFLTCDQEQQERRFQERLGNPLKRWKLSPVDVQARERYDAYTKAREAMLDATHTKHAPWTLVDFNDQKRGRLTLLRHLLDHVPGKRPPLVQGQLTPLAGKLGRERYGALKPIRDYVPKAALKAISRSAAKASRPRANGKHPEPATEASA
ncbi:MAG: polyphosphate kinase 2 [Allosphingosinicella sp.]